MNQLFQTLAELYGKSALRKRDFTIDYEKFLRLANAGDGDERELAENALRFAESESGGIFGIDRHRKSGLPLTVRLSAEGGEEWLFSKIGKTKPTREREELARYFEQCAERSIPETWATAWKEWCASLASRAMSGASLQPFSKTGNHDLMEALTGVLNWQGESLIRYASARICGDSKKLQALESRLVTALGEITGEHSLEAFGILHKPRSVNLHGPLVLEIGDSRIDFSALPGTYTLSETNIAEASHISTAACICLTVENEDVFMELAKRNPGALLIQTSFPGSAVRRLIARLPEMDFHHFGDSDPAGFDILRDLREKTGKHFRPILMEHRPSPQRIPLSSLEHETLARLIANPSMEDVRDEMQKMSASDDKGIFEQERVPVDQVFPVLFGSCARMK
jgi:Uncharacterized protein conserved in bacteria C-term(DUF2220)